MKDNVLPAYAILIIPGEIQLKSKRYARQWSYASQIIVHPRYNNAYLQNDVAVVRVRIIILF